MTDEVGPVPDLDRTALRARARSGVRASFHCAHSRLTAHSAFVDVELHRDEGMAADTQLFLGCIAVLLLLPALLSPWSILLLVLRPLALLSGGLLTLFIIAFLVSSRRKRRPPRALPRQLAFTTPAAWASARVRHQWAQARSTAHEPLHQSMSPDLTASVDVLFALVISTFVSRWFDELTGPAAHQGFPDAIERLVRTSLAKVIARCETVDWVDLLVGTLVPRLTNHLNRFREAEVKLRGSNKHAGPAAALAGSDELDLLLATGYARQKGGLHAAVDVASFSSRPSEEAHLRRLVDRILPLVLPEWWAHRLWPDLACR
jgi:sorting nexin-25